MTTQEYEPVAETEDCQYCGGAYAGYAFDGDTLFEFDHCRHQDICRECELVNPCDTCTDERREDAAVEQAEWMRREERMSDD